LLHRYAILFGLLLAGLMTPTHAADTPRQITVYVTVDWEGLSLKDENIAAMRDFRRRHPQIPILQLLNPAYFLRHHLNAAQTREKIRATLLPNDTLGLHIHPWKTLMDHCAVPYRGTPAFTPQEETCAEGKDCGYTVSLEFAYTEAELTTLIACSADILQAQGFGRPRTFRAGGWQLGPKLTAALLANNFVADSSHTDAHLLTNRWDAASGLVQMVQQLNPAGSPLDQPFELQPGLMEFPDNGSLADYTSTQKIREIFGRLLANRKTVLVLGFHQETAFDYLHRLEDAIPLLEQDAKVEGVTLTWGSIDSSDAKLGRN
jgi:hypothetical protein